MPLSQEYQFELSLFEKEIELQKPSDFLQFASNYFNKRLELQRQFIKNQEQLAKSKGIILFPTNNNRNDSVSAGNAISNPNSHSNSNVDIPSQLSRNATPVDSHAQNVKFKSPFADNDPHTVPHHDDTGSSNFGKDHSNENSSSDLFKGSFNLGGSLNQQDVEDPHAMNRKRNNHSPLGPFDGHQNTESKANKKTAATSIAAATADSNGATPLPFHFNAERRTSVSGETINPDNFDDWTPENFSEKSDSQLKRLEQSIGKNFLFNKLDSDNRRLVVNCLEEKAVQKGDVIIQQGDEGDYFYIVEQGVVEFYVNKQRVSTSGAGSSFGELALMYNSPRAATVIAQTDCILWVLDRLTFRKILLGSSFKKRLMYDDLLRSIPVLKSLTTYDRAKLADALDTQIYEPNQVIIKEGDSGENFYLVEYGKCSVTKKDKGEVASLTKGSYFGEVALINDLPRQATVTATERTKVAFLGKSGFQRLLGPVVDVLKLNDPTREEREAQRH
ncbi:similar to Saccharomyces cerevisiae YIL033C BCY1 Regulatory subunit of the cyclic AMP- dependent protein kinase (PKA) [Maudiozyma barnettii]|uniref:cAMP-dependent protein kinase regulatory subunit n=1 Tax=Maudiozyma barnettii TaxID=61262 RepID=A0A8H2VHG0_9SACH|nr:cAMP-dependent protein kinase regulatory subunit BCY1 [Kazachstania barnettii]CAB4255739.1 similar to Saccharomyces cerevisiae YIL033C BCY1 Regulatory subunit of the cyclic AMP- dependent protein kinase (PKA) [Kazachstania barnettii]CAD1784300.1 similar to Saccharomyces cerevisiae YIL033C BCY1 Regulatory subunit of the cyclic AMP- dependent protein kinase (PKA) [Kazachstania barnettii]